MSKQIIMPILENDGSLESKIIKLHEELGELSEAYYRGLEKDLAEEAFDCLQVIMGIVLEIEKHTHIDLEDANDTHVAKLVNRQMWTIKDGMVRIKIPS